MVDKKVDKYKKVFYYAFVAVIKRLLANKKSLFESTEKKLPENKEFHVT